MFRQTVRELMNGKLRFRHGSRSRIVGLVLLIGLIVPPITLAAAVPTADPQSVVTPVDVPITIRLTAHDGDPNAALTFLITSGPAHGILGPTSGSMDCPPGTPTDCSFDVLYTPTGGYSGTDAFDFTVDDGTFGGTSLPATVSITVNGAPVVATSGGTTAYTEGGPAVAVDAGLTVTDADSTNQIGRAHV